jgi:hypothetical protein
MKSSVPSRQFSTRAALCKLYIGLPLYCLSGVAGIAKAPLFRGELCFCPVNCFTEPDFSRYELLRNGLRVGRDVLHEEVAEPIVRDERVS